MNFGLEVNTRLQLVCLEMVTGIDLVKEQISIADGNKLNFIQNDVVPMDILKQGMLRIRK